MEHFFGVAKENLTDLFDIGISEFIGWCVQALLAGYIGERLLIDDKP